MRLRGANHVFPSFAEVMPIYHPIYRVVAEVWMKRLNLRL